MRLATLFLTGLLSLATGCVGSNGSGESGHFEITDVGVDEAGPGVYEVTFDAQWEGELSVQESRCIVQVFGSDQTLLAKGREKVKDPGTGLTTIIRGDKGSPEEATVLCPEVAHLNLDE